MARHQGLLPTASVDLWARTLNALEVNTVALGKPLADCIPGRHLDATSGD